MKTEFQMILIAARVALEKQVERSPTSGVRSGDNKMRYADAIPGIDRIQRYFTDREKRAYGKCDDCGKVLDVRA